MADKAAQLEAFKAAASNYQSQIETAASKDEALTLAISAAENLMKALKLCSKADEKKELRTRFNAITDVAHRSKSAEVWSLTKNDQLPPHSPPQSQIQTQRHPTKSEEIDQWAANVAEGAAPADTHEEPVSETSSSLVDPSSTGMAPKIVPASGKASTSTFSSFVAGGSAPQPAKIESHVLRDYSSHESTRSPITNVRTPATIRRKDNGDVLSAGQETPHEAAVRTDGSTYGLQRETLPPATPALAPYSHIHRLTEPISSRKRSKKEEIILLKASIVNGFKCPPWDKSPLASEFVLGNSIDLFTDTHDLTLSTYQQQFFKGWARPKEAVPPPSVFPGDRNGIGPLMSTSRAIDLVQDAATDCSVVASLCSGLARADRGHDQILSNKVYPFDKNLGKPVMSQNGKYIVSLNFNGCWRKVIIDDRLPLSSTHRLLHVMDRRQPALLWPALLEKAYLKVRGGYDFPGSNSCSDLWTLTGWIPEQVHLQETDTVPDQLWNRIYKAFMYGDVLVTLGTGVMSSRQERELGLEGQHSYAVLDMRETDHDRLLLVKNPWAEGKGWRGPRPSVGPILDSSTSSGGTGNSLEAYHRDSIPSKDRPYPTTFWIGLGQVIRHFESLYLNWNPGLFLHRQDIHFEWNIGGPGEESGSIVTHPQFSFWCKDADHVFFLLTRHFRDTHGDSKDESDAFNDGSVRPDTLMNPAGEASKGYMSVYVCSGNGERLYIKESYLESSDYVTTPQCLLRWDTDENSTYTVVVDQDELPASSYTFTLSAFARTKIMLEPATQKYPLQRIVTGEWTKQTAGGSTSSPRYFENPQYTLEVKERGPLAILLTSTTHKNPLHVKLSLGYGKRVYRLQSRDVLADSGDHRTGCVFTENDDLQPGLYTIICSLFEAGQIGDFTLRVDSTADVTLKPIPRDGAGLMLMKLSPACFGSEVQKVAAPIVPHRLANYTIVARFAKATTPRSMAALPVARSPFRFSVELGRGPERKFVIASERGEYSDSAIVRSEAVNIDPGLFASGDLWLVLDRLSGPGGPVEEWYDVEIFTDVPQACAVGVWRIWND